MTYSQATQPRIQLTTQQIMSGSILMAIGGVLALTGATIVGTALVAAYRERVRQMEVPPSVLARQNWDRVKAASAAGMSEWRNGRRPAQASSR